jgi:hypothetical protein
MRIGCNSIAPVPALGRLKASPELIGVAAMLLARRDDHGDRRPDELAGLTRRSRPPAAGEHGRGFAVVAEEVRKLAEESQRAAGEISGLIEGMQTETRDAVSIVQESVTRTDHGVTTVGETRTAFRADRLGRRRHHRADPADGRRLTADLQTRRQNEGQHQRGCGRR